jgi:hypothetical protein
MWGAGIHPEGYIPTQGRTVSGQSRLNPHNKNYIFGWLPLKNGLVIICVLGTRGLQKSPFCTSVLTGSFEIGTEES